MRYRDSLALVFAGAWLCILCGCSKTDDDAPRTTQQAVARLDQAFAGADPATRQIIGTMSEALGKGDYDQAVVSLRTIQSAPSPTPEQHRAVLDSAAAIEAKLIYAMDAGDENAKRAYQLLKALKQK